MSGTVNNPDLHLGELKRKINKNIGSDYLCQPWLFKKICEAGKQQEQKSMKSDPGQCCLNRDQRTDCIKQNRKTQVPEKLPEVITDRKILLAKKI